MLPILVVFTWIALFCPAIIWSHYSGSDGEFGILEVVVTALLGLAPVLVISNAKRLFSEKSKIHSKEQMEAEIERRVKEETAALRAELEAERAVTAMMLEQTDASATADKKNEEGESCHSERFSPDYLTTSPKKNVSHHLPNTESFKTKFPQVHSLNGIARLTAIEHQTKALTTLNNDVKATPDTDPEAADGMRCANCNELLADATRHESGVGFRCPKCQFWQG
jgi:hypothetical protein